MGDHKAYYPSEWQDDQSMDVLFSPFRDNREVNPHSWDRKMKFWTDMICEECRFSKSPIINIKSLPQRFIRNGKVPVCLETVFKELQRHGKIERVDNFKSSVGAGWLSWGVNIFVKKPISFSFRTARHMLGWQENTSGDYVVTDVLKNQANELLECHAKRVQSSKTALTRDIMDMEGLQEETTAVCADEEALELLVLQLVKDKRVVVSHTDMDRQVLRFQGDNEKQAKDITELELQALKLKNTSNRLLAQIEQIAEEMERCRNDAKFYLGKGLRNSAKNALRRKKMLESLMAKRQSALENIEGLLHRINNAESDKMVLGAYTDGTKAYKNMVASMGLTPDNIDNIMDDVQEVFDVQEEINGSISQAPRDPELDMTATDLEAELEAILASDSQDEQLAEQLAGMDDGIDRLALSEKDFPDVPTFDPATPPRVTSPIRPQTARGRPFSPRDRLPAS